MKRRDAFTMTELLVLIPIAALLGVLLLASLGDAKEKAKSAVCMNNLREIGVAISLYANDHDDYYPPGFVATVGDWPFFIGSYLGKKPTTYGNPIDSSKALLCPSGVQSQTNLPVRLMYSAHTRLMPPSSIPSYGLYKRGRVARPTEIVLVADGIQTSVYYPGSFDAAANFEGVATSKLAYNPATADVVLTTNALAGSNQDGVGPNLGKIRLRHFGNSGANFLFCDGHVEGKVVGQLKARNFMYDP
jgi:prepilin-type processing-associated H-X9-DG protein